MPTSARDDARRLLVIGLDAADRELIDRWCEEGALPHLARLRSEGAWTALATTADVLHVSAWPSIFSGTTPDKHGLYHAYVMHRGEQTPGRPRPDRTPVPFVWKLLDEAGKRCIVMDAFLTCPVQPFGGVQIVDWGSWTWFWDQTILPAPIKREMARRFGPYPAENHSKVGMTPPPDPEGFRERLLKGVAKKTAVLEWLTTTQEWDFLLAVFGECHAAGHYFWHYQDPAYVAYPETCSATLRGALKEVYVALDGAIGELLSRVDEGTTVWVISGDGMGPNYSGSHLLNGLLERMGLSGAPASSGKASDGQAPAARGRKDLLSTLRGLVPKELRAAVSRHLLPRALNERLSLHWKTAGIDWSRTRAFLIDNANEGYIRVNLRGREPLGIVTADDEYEDICTALVSAADSLTNPLTGKRAAAHVHRARDLYAGPCADVLPDVIVNWDPEALVTTELLTAEHGRITSPDAAWNVPPYYTGNHRPNAFIAARGPAVAPAALEPGAGVLDLAPSILAHFGIEPPAHLDGRPLPWLSPRRENDS